MSVHPHKLWELCFLRFKLSGLLRRAGVVPRCIVCDWRQRGLGASSLQRLDVLRLFEGKHLLETRCGFLHSLVHWIQVGLLLRYHAAVLVLAHLAHNYSYFLLGKTAVDKSLVKQTLDPRNHQKCWLGKSKTYVLSRTALGKIKSRKTLRSPLIRSNVFTSRKNWVDGSWAQSIVTGGPSIQDELSERRNWKCSKTTWPW